MASVSIQDPGRMNLLGLMLADVIQRNVDTPDGRRAADRFSGNIIVRAGEMTATLVFGDGNVSIERGRRADAVAEIHGSLDTFVELALGHNPLVPLLTRRLRLRGNPLALLRIRPLLRATDHHNQS